MDVVLCILAVMCALVGIVGSIVPALPGPPVAYLGLVLMAFVGGNSYSWVAFVVYGVLLIAVQVADFYLPIKITQKFGGSPYAQRGSLVGVFVGMFLLFPVGLILWPFVGAIIGERMWDKSASTEHVLKVGSGAFLAFILGTGAKIIFSIVVLVDICVEIATLLF
jgi:uncharacterized protein YqgC (DUF456 family)